MSTAPNPIRQASDWTREINGLEHLFKAISDAGLYSDPDLTPVITQMQARLAARRAELTALISLYGG